MAEKKGIYPQGDYPFAPSAPVPSNQNHGLPSYIPDRPPPPSYEESQKMQCFGVAPNGTPSAPTMSPSHKPSSTGMNVSYPQLNQGYGHVPVGNAQPQYSAAPLIHRPVLQYNNGNTPMNQQYNKSVHVLQYDSGARFSGKGGASVSVPPPPPGVAPTPAQMAAMQGQPVILQKKKNSFF